MREDYSFYNRYCYDRHPIDFKVYILDQLRNLGKFSWLRDEPTSIKDEKEFLNSTQRIPYLEREIERDKSRIKKAKDFLKKLEEYPDEEYEKYVKDETEKWQAQYNTKIHNASDYATEHVDYLNKRANELEMFISKWVPPVEFNSVIETLNNQLLTVRKEVEKIKSDRSFFYEKLPEKPELMSKEEFIVTNKEECEDTIKRCQKFISDNKENIKRMKKQDIETCKLFESLKIFDKEV